MTASGSNTSYPAEHIDLTYVMLRFTPSLCLQPRRRTIVYAMVRLSGRIARDRHGKTEKQTRPFERRKFRSDGACRQRIAARTIPRLLGLPSQPNIISEMAESLAQYIIDVVSSGRSTTPTTSHTQYRVVRASGNLIRL